ncbi:MAG TPA: DNA polymerase ligase N-terminal domain-containing protein [Thermoanaerobaculia bacterium]|jgi:bifunctional non-homologous end joining protein LigD|nr:DNA polymerase ligase N-terminal domain-containing protein [Thermoanaerobaculia bacterium]
MPDLLKKYRQMRDFADTPEPAGGKPKRGKLPIFVIQKHRASRLHYDFRLEMEGVLKSWAIPKGPSYDPATKRLAMMTEDHPYDYGSFEGVIPAGNYGAGNVIVWDNGEWEFIEPGDDPVAALKSGKLTFRLYGKKMFGEWALVRIKGKGNSDRGNEWLLLKHRDPFANDKVDVTEVAPRSILSNKLVEEVGPENVWISNRKAASRKAPTVADKLASRQVVESPRRTARKKPLDDSKTRRPVDSTKTAAAKKAPSRAASVRTRSSRAAAKSPARPTARRRPR